MIKPLNPQQSHSCLPPGQPQIQATFDGREAQSACTSVVAMAPMKLLTKEDDKSVPVKLEECCWDKWKERSLLRSMSLRLVELPPEEGVLAARA